MRLIPSALRRDKVLTKEQRQHIKDKVHRFLKKTPLNESVLILDGPGYGCSNAAYVISLLGHERLSQLKAIHSFSSSCYQILWYLAHQEQQLQLNAKDLVNWNRQVQKLHDIQPGKTLVRTLLSKLKGNRFIPAYPVAT